MKKLVLFIILAFFTAGTASTQTFDLWLWNGLGPAPTAVSPKGIAGVSSATIQADATGSAGFLYRQTDWSNKWATAATANSLGVLDFYNGADGSVSVTSGNYYTFNVPTSPSYDATNLFAILETTAEPVTITSVTRDFSQPIPSEPVEVTVTLSGTKTAEELVYVLWTKTAWETYNVESVTITGTSGSVSISPQPEGTDVSYYAVTTTINSAIWGTSGDFAVLRVNNNGGTNYNYTSTIFSDNTLPTTVSDLDATSDPDLRKITLSWTPVTEENFETYEIYYNTVGNPGTGDTKLDKNDIVDLGMLSTSSVVISGLDWATTYYFKIRGVDQSANAGTLSNTASATTVSEPLIVMDGVFDGTEKWGDPVYTATNTTDGWSGANATNLYITYDENYTYLGAEMTKEAWQYWVFIINTQEGGASQDSWGRNVFFNHTNLPDYSIRQGSSEPYAQFNTWDGESWNYNDNTIAVDSWYKLGSNFVEVRVSRSMLGNAVIGDVQFYITGNNGDHGAFDCLPDDDNSTGWSAPEVVSDLSFYASGVTLPVELASFSVAPVANGARLIWETATETNNAGFEVLRNGTSIGFVAGKGTTTDRQSYLFTDANVTGTVSYQLKQIDMDGSVHYSSLLSFTGQVSVFEVIGNYPNPFNPETSIRFTTPEAGMVTVRVFNMIGQEIGTLVNTRLDAGNHSVPFNANGLSSGLYFYSVSMNRKTITKSMTLMK